jgi:hypothetical protein
MSVETVATGDEAIALAEAEGEWRNHNALSDRELAEHTAERVCELMALLERARPALEAFAAFDPDSAPGWMKALLPGLR